MKLSAMQSSVRFILSGVLALASICFIASSLSAATVAKTDEPRVIELTSTSLPTPMKVTVALPEQYETTDCDYPVVYLLNGYGGDYRTWPSIINVDSLATRYNCLVVCPSGFNSWYFDSPVDESMQMESFITSELVLAIDSLYRTRADRSGRAITGLSMGGHGALWLAIRHSDLFGSAGSTSGGVDFTPWPDSWKIKDFLGTQDSNPERWRSHTVASLVPDLKPSQLNLIIDCGTEDFFYDVNCSLDHALNEAHIPHAFITNPGAHNGAYWSRSIGPQFDFFARHF
ncbi:MAG: esterase family protein [Paramuribaculum sp.]|nr:esterase family protein [Paramuribaculum sp.]